MALSRDEQLADDLRALILAAKRNQLERYNPYPKQKEFHAAGAKYKERLLVAGNRLGKSFCAGFEVAMHATGRYPDWWEGRRFDKPVLIWTGAETNEASKTVTQKILLGTEEPYKSSPDFGQGALPYDSIVKVTTRQAGVKGVADQIVVEHVSGGHSIIRLMTYEMGRPKWQGAAVNVVWPDEEANNDIYSEAVTRTMDTGGIVLATFTPLKGMTSVVKRFLQPDEGDAPRHVTTMTIYDALHFKGQELEILSNYPKHERKSRGFGVPMAGEGLVWPIDEEELVVPPFQIPSYWPRIAGIDFGADHPTAGAWLAWDRDNDILYLTDTYKKAGETPLYHAQAFLTRGAWIRVAWPHDGYRKDMSKGKSGVPMYRMYKNHGVNMLFDSARALKEDGTEMSGGAQPLEPSVARIYERMRTDRFKVFSPCKDFLDEMRLFHRKDGQIVAKNDDVISAFRYAEMMLRKATSEADTGPRAPKRARMQPVVEQWA